MTSGGIATAKTAESLETNNSADNLKIDSHSLVFTNKSSDLSLDSPKLETIIRLDNREILEIENHSEPKLEINFSL